jgi:elongation factor P--(R)-beta-lysine ligase
MTWRPTASLQALQTRARMLKNARDFFAEHRVMEVETPILSAAAVSDAQLESLHTRIAGLPQEFYLHTSPEYAMKRLLAAGSGDIYQICKVFRDAERGRWHNPEFTMMEWYRTGFDDCSLMDEIERLLRRLVTRKPLPDAERLSYSAALERHAGVSAHQSSDAELAAAASRHGIVCEADLDRDGQLDLLMGLIVGPKLGWDRPCFICDYPASQAALARLKPGLPAVAARFELYMDGVELANGFHELQSAREQRSRFEHDLQVRRSRGQPQLPLDEHFLAALQSGLPDCAGVALGFDRLVAIELKADRLGEAMAFTVDNA